MPDRMTTAKILSYLYRRILDELGRGDEEELNYLSTTVRELWEAAESYRDGELYVLLGDMNHVLNETLMGAQAKGELYLDSIASKIKELEEAEQKNPSS